MLGAVAARQVDKLIEGIRVLAGATFARVPFRSTHPIGSNQHMSRRIVLPIIEQIIDLPERELVNVSEGPSGSGGDVAIQKRPVD